MIDAFMLEYMGVGFGTAIVSHVLFFCSFGPVYWFFRMLKP